mgnify:CR=1 FL=1
MLISPKGVLLLVTVLAFAINGWMMLRFRRLSRDIAFHLGRERELDEPGAEGLSVFEERLYQQLRTGVGLPLLDDELAHRARVIGKELRLTYWATATLVLIWAVVCWIADSSKI